ncbi:MAG: adenylyl-sulfate kinase [Euryarchaeota archaeon]|nr:adenylyl-sulfate kinase [Euryarchaeota archaeon]MDE1835300.1 adenylyl-sulfate kinase [Euryarchaeota archaeon]MDE1880571.1 adenylyl-sulfate kinase [Euryarchaeota archaeon]MDE2043596.1 adenylyl-sulfate kinase [Thermoplasmata archaeon]
MTTPHPALQHVAKTTGPPPIHLAKKHGRPGFVLWMEGLSGSGKSTLSKTLAAKLHADGWNVEILDGDEVRQGLSPDLGFSRKDRETHAHRVSYVARVLSRNGVAVLVALITPYESSRKAARTSVGERFTEVYIKAPLDICQKRDVKGLYKKTQSGHVTQMTGVDDPFEEPANPDLVVDTSSDSVETCAGVILGHLKAKGFLPN